jgi:hypothetical protein
MTTINYIGASIANFKSVKLVPGVNALASNAIIQIGLGPYLLSLSGGWNATSLANLWNTSANPFIQQVTATAQGTALILTANTAGQDFEPVCLVNGSAVQVSSIQVLSIVAGAGTFTVSDTVITSGAITYSGTPATLVSHIQSAINAMSGYSSGDVAVSYNSTNGTYVLDFSGGQFAGVNVPLWTANGSSLTGGTAAATITRNQTGNAGTDEIVSITFPAAGTHTANVDTIQEIQTTLTSGSFTLTVSGVGTTAPIPYNAGRSTIKRLLEDLVGQGNTIVTGGPLTTVTVSNPVFVSHNGTETNMGYSDDYAVTFTNGNAASVETGEASQHGFIRFTLPVAQGTVLDSVTLNASLIGVSSGTNTPPFGFSLAAVQADNPAWPTTGSQAATQLGMLGTPVDFTVTALNQPTASIDITAAVQTIVNRSGWVSGNAIILVLYGTSLNNGGFVQGSSSVVAITHSTTTTTTHYPVYVEFTGTYAGQSIAQMTVTGSNTTTTVTQTGGSQTVQNITGGVWSLVVPGHFSVPNIPYNVTASALQTLINAANNNVACCTVTGGPAPGTALTIHFNGALATTALNPYITLSLTGSFGDTVNLTQICAAEATPSATNVYELTVCPGEGTLAISPASADISRFFAVLTILEPNATNPSYAPAPQRQIFIPLLNINADRIESAINESFGQDVVRVCRTSHSLEHNSLATNENVSAVNSEASFVHFWYYVDKFRLVFVNKYADPTSITQIAVSFGSTSPTNATPAGPSIWMSTTGIPAAQTSGGDIKDMYPEYVRTYLGFTGMNDVGTPIHQLTITPYTSYTDNKLSYKGKLMSQYPFVSALATPSTPVGQEPNRAGMNRQLIDNTVVFNWYAYTYTTDQEAPSNTELLASTSPIPWNAQPEVFQSVLETIFGAGNVSVSGSLVNSWQSESSIDVPDITQAYQELRITLINQCAYLPFNEFGYGLSMTLSNPFSQDNDTVRSAVPYLEPYSKPLPTQRNNRYRMVVSAGLTNQFTIGVGSHLINITTATTVSSAQTQLNALLGTCSCPAPAKYQQAVTMYGTDFTKPVEIEFTGAGYQFTQQALVFGFSNSTSVGLLTVTQVGVNPTSEVQQLAITGSPYSGTYTVHGSGNIAYNANAATIQTALGASPPVVSGTYPVFLLTWPSASGPQSLYTTTSSLNNASVGIIQTQQGGTSNGVSANVAVSDLIQGQGPLYWDNAANFSPAQVPGSGDTVIFDDATTAVTFGLDQSSIFTVASTGSNATLRHTRLRQVFQSNQKVLLANQGTAPTGLTLGNSYYIVNPQPDYTFQLAATPGGTPIAITSVGVGPLLLCVSAPTIQIYSRYAGNQIGLPNINVNTSLPEYLARYLKISGPTMLIGLGDGNPLSMLRVDTMNGQASINVLTSGQSLVNNIPAFLFLFNNTLSSLNITDGDCGIAVYSDETSTIGSITGTGGTLLLHAVNAGSIQANGLTVTEQNVAVSGMSTL